MCAAEGLDEDEHEDDEEDAEAATAAAGRFVVLNAGGDCDGLHAILAVAELSACLTRRWFRGLG